MSVFDLLSGSNRIPKEVKKSVMIAEARARETLSNIHTEQAIRFVRTLEAFLPYDEALDRYVVEMGLSHPMDTIVQGKALTKMGNGVEGAKRSPEPRGSSLNPFTAVRHLKESREREREAEARIRFLSAVAQDAVIAGHVEAATEFVALFDGYLPAHRAIEVYTNIRELKDFVAEVVYQKTMSQVGEVYLATRLALPSGEPEEEAGGSE